MKISQKGPADTDLSKLVQNEKAVGAVRREGDSKVRQSGESARVNISAEARELQRIAELARRGDQARAEKVGQIKQQIESGKYQVDAGEVSRDILRSEVTRLLAKK
jgi:flagellar biosynthesis anti-sigma factor FlgM